MAIVLTDQQLIQSLSTGTLLRLLFASFSTSGGKGNVTDPATSILYVFTITSATDFITLVSLELESRLVTSGQ